MKASYPLPEQLTRRENDILLLLDQNLTDREIAERLVLSLNSVKWYTRQIYGKLGVQNRRQAVTRFREMNRQVIQEPRLQPSNNLPRQLTSFVGREKEIEQVVRMVRKHPLVTVTGTGGVGKTRLALEAARALLDDFPDGVWWIELAPVIEPAFIPVTIASIFSIHTATPEQQVAALRLYFAPKVLLLILDNCEHLTSAVAALCTSLLEGCPKLSILTTSREIMDVEGEFIFPCPSLSLPESLPEDSPKPVLKRAEASEAARLFESRAAAALPDFYLTEENATCIIDICRHLDGIPLAIELVAARLRLLSLGEIVNHMNDVFGLAAGSRRVSDPRHKTLKATIDWSYQLLSPLEKTLLCRLSIFGGGWTIGAAEAVGGGRDIKAGEVLDSMQQLVHKSLILVESTEYGRNRYRMLETIRQYARAKLVEAGEEEASLCAYLDYYVDLSAQAKKQLRGPDSPRWLDWMMAELPNLRAATDWSLVTDPVLGMRICSSLFWFWYIRTIMRIGSPMLERCLDADAARYSPTPEGDLTHALVRGEALNVLLFFHIHGYQVQLSGIGYATVAQRIEGREKIDRRIKEAEALFRSIGKPGRPGLAFLYRYGSTFLADNPLDAEKLLEESLAIAHEEGNLFEIAESLSYLGNHLFGVDRSTNRAKRYIAEECVLRKEIGDIDGIAWVNFELGIIALWDSDFPQAQGYFEQSLRLYRQVKQIAYQHRCQSYLAHLACLQGNYEIALRYADAMLVASNETGIIWFIVTALQRKAEALLLTDPIQADLLNRQALTYLAEKTIEIYADVSLELQVSLEMIQGRLLRAAQLQGALDHFAKNVYPYQRSRWDHSLVTLKTSLGADAFDRAYSAGSAMTLAQVMAFAMDVPGEN